MTMSPAPSAAVLELPAKIALIHPHPHAYRTVHGQAETLDCRLKPTAPFCPSTGAFNMVTGPLHWELLARGRAVDNQCYVMTCSPARNPEASYQAWGHSTVVGPFAEVLATCEHEPTTVYAELDYGQVVERRTNLPLRQQKRFDLYELVDKQQQQQQRK